MNAALLAGNSTTRKRFHIDFCFANWLNESSLIQGLLLLANYCAFLVEVAGFGGVRAFSSVHNLGAGGNNCVSQRGD